MEHSLSQDPQQELLFIRNIIAESRQSLVEDGKPYIMWGLVVAVAMTFTYISALLNRDLYTGWLWIGLVAFALLYSWYYAAKNKQREPKASRTFLSNLGGAIWTACGIALGLTIVLIMTGYSEKEPSIHPIYICSLVSLILGIAYFLSGIVNDIKWLRNLSFVWWLGGVGMFYYRSIHVLGIYALMILLFQVVPGIILQRRYKILTAVPNDLETKAAR